MLKFGLHDFREFSVRLRLNPFKLINDYYPTGEFGFNLVQALLQSRRSSNLLSSDRSEMKLSQPFPFFLSAIFLLVFLGAKQLLCPEMCFFLRLPFSFKFLKVLKLINC